jgi:hypothetical protein
LGIYHVKFGSKKARYLARRRKRVELKRRELAGEEVIHEDSDDDKKEGGDKDEDVDVEMNDAESEPGAAANVPEDGTVSDNDEEEGDGDARWGPVEDGDNDGNNDSNNDGSNDGSNEDQEWEDESSNHGSNSEHNSSTGDGDGTSDQNDGSGSEDDDIDDNFSDKWSQATELSVPAGFEMSHNCKETDDMYKFYEEHSYDPEKLKRKDVQWIDRCRVLGLNGELKGKKRAFISGRGRYSDYFDFNVKKFGDDPRDPIIGEHPVYHCYEPAEMIMTFPFHEECYKLLTRCMGYKSRKRVNKDVLYDIMIQNVQELGSDLSLDYGDVEGAEQFWESYAGHEWSVADPRSQPGIEDVVKSMLPASLFSPPPRTALNLSHKVKNDPLEVLPYDVLYGIFAELSLKDTLSLVNASLHVFDSTRESAFWRHMIRLHIVPFFYELDGMLRVTTFPDTFDWKGAFQWLDSITKPAFAMEGPLMPIANRRRIWNACQQVAALYFEKVNAEAYADPSDAEAAQILGAAKSYHMPLTMFPPPEANKTSITTAQFIRSWSEIGYRACDVETYWSEQSHKYGTLIGMSIDFGSAPRLFGKAEGLKGSSLHLKAGDWIKGIKVYVWPANSDTGRGFKEDIKSEKDATDENRAYINGMAVSSMYLYMRIREANAVCSYVWPPEKKNTPGQL